MWAARAAGWGLGVKVASWLGVEELVRLCCWDVRGPPCCECQWFFAPKNLPPATRTMAMRLPVSARTPSEAHGSWVRGTALVMGFGWRGWGDKFACWVSEKRHGMCLVSKVFERLDTSVLLFLELRCG